MDRSILCRMLDLQEEMITKPDYAGLLEEYRRCNDRFLEQMRTMSSLQQDAVWDYLGVLTEIHRKTLELALRSQ